MINKETVGYSDSEQNYDGMSSEDDEDETLQKHETCLDGQKTSMTEFDFAHLSVVFAAILAPLHQSLMLPLL